MIAVSPWFSTHFNTKNWVFVCENLPTLRWEQMLSLQPDLIEIITWNGTLTLYIPGKSSRKLSSNHAVIQITASPTTSARTQPTTAMMGHPSGRKTCLTMPGAIYSSPILQHTNLEQKRLPWKQTKSCTGTDLRPRASCAQVITSQHQWVPACSAIVFLSRLC